MVGDGGMMCLRDMQTNVSFITVSRFLAGGTGVVFSSFPPTAAKCLIPHGTKKRVN